MKQKTIKKVVPAEQQGKRKAPVPTDEMGCKHSGVQDLLPMEQGNCMYYLKDHRWLVGKLCADCKKDVQKIVEETPKKIQTKLHYCNHGITAMNKGVDEEFRKLLSCDLVLCNDCHQQRLEKLQTNEKNGGRTSRRSKSTK